MMKKKEQNIHLNAWHTTYTLLQSRYNINATQTKEKKSKIYKLCPSSFITNLLITSFHFWLSLFNINPNRNLRFTFNSRKLFHIQFTLTFFTVSNIRQSLISIYMYPHFNTADVLNNGQNHSLTLKYYYRIELWIHITCESYKKLMLSPLKT